MDFLYRCLRDLLSTPFPLTITVQIYLHSKSESWAPFLRWMFPIHDLFLSFLTLLAGSSLIVCVVRDPGSVRGEQEQEAAAEEESESTGLSAALLRRKNTSIRWCDTCKAHQPSRAVHCSTCSRCVLKMDHHSPLTLRCIGHRTQGPYLHFILSITLIYIFTAPIAILSSLIIGDLPPSELYATPPIDIIAIFISFGGVGITLVWAWFTTLYTFTNQTLYETSNPSHILPYLPPPFNTRNFRDLSHSQKQFINTSPRVGGVKLWDLGVIRNWSDAFGYGGSVSGLEWSWWKVVWWGGRPKGDGTYFQMRAGVKEGLGDFGRKLRELER